MSVSAWSERVEASEELFDSKYSICCESSTVEFGMVDHHLLEVGQNSLRIMIREVGLQIVQRRIKPVNVVRESLPYHGRRFHRTASVVVEEHKCNVVPVLGLTPRVRSRCLGEQEPGQPDDVHFRDEGDPADSSSEFVHFNVARRESSTSQVHRAEVLALVKPDRRFCRSVAKISEELELHDRRSYGRVRHPAPDTIVLGDELCIEERPLKARGIHRTTCNLEVDLYVYVGSPCMLKPAFRTEQFRDQSSKHDKLRPCSIVVYDTHQRLLGRCARGTRADKLSCRAGITRRCDVASAATRLIGHGSPPGDARRPPRLVHRRYADLRTPWATVRRAGHPARQSAA